MEHMQFRPPAASTFAVDVDELFFTLVSLTILFTLIVAGVLIYFTILYRRGSRVDRSRPLMHNTALEATWSLGPLFLAMCIFLWAAKLFAGVFTPPKNAKEIFVVGKQWMWHIQHANGIRENNELHIPVGEPVKFTMISQDVIHGFFIPEFRIQRQVEPGQYTEMWCQPTQTGRFHLFCNMYCGTQHSEMGGWVYVMSRADYQKWAATGGAHPVAVGGYEPQYGQPTLEEQGQALFDKYECVSCHGTDAVERGRGPSLVNIYGKVRTMTDGRKLVADDGYLHSVMFDPNENVLAGWPAGMPSYRNVLTEDQVIAVNSYVKSLNGKPEPNAGNTYAIQNLAPNGDGSGGYGGMSGTGAGIAESTQTNQPGPVSEDGGYLDQQAPAANTNNQQWRYMYGGDR
jgi:cytochrome c oxidase subunit 2